MSNRLDKDTRALIDLALAVSAIIPQLHADSIEVVLTEKQARTCLGACRGMQEYFDIKQEAEQKLNQKGNRRVFSINEVDLALAIKNISASAKGSALLDETVLFTIDGEYAILEATNRYMATAITISGIDAPKGTGFARHYCLDKLLDWAKTVKTGKRHPYQCGFNPEKNLLSTRLGEIVLEPAGGFPHVALLDAKPVDTSHTTGPGDVLFILDQQYMKALPAASKLKGVEFYRVAANTIGFKGRLNENITWRAVIQGMSPSRSNSNIPAWQDEMAA